MKNKTFKASAPAKIILLGEHFVVYGEPAIALAIDKRAQASAELREDERIYVNSLDLASSGFFMDKHFQLERGGQETRSKLEPIRIAVQGVLDLSGKRTGVSVEIQSSISIASGLGSSAAVATAVAAAVGQLLGLELTREEIFRVAYEAECFVHKRPSGIDPMISTNGGVLFFSKNEGVTPLRIEFDVPLIIGDTGMERSTGELVNIVRKRRERYPSIIKSIMKTGGNLAFLGVDALKTRDLDTLGELMNINHALLCSIGVSNFALEKLVYTARKAGALGAKLVGAGGGGCMVALCQPNEMEPVIDAIRHAGGTPFVARKTDEGVEIER